MSAIETLSQTEAKREGREAIRSLAEAAAVREATIEERLRAVMSLAAGAAALALAIGVPQLRGELGSSKLGLVLTLTVAFANLQLLRALFAAVLGLGRRSYRAPTTIDLVPMAGEEEGERESRVAALWYDYMYDLVEAGNYKVSQMSVAYRALKNFVAAVVVATLSLVGSQIFQLFVPTESECAEIAISGDRASEKGPAILDASNPANGELPPDEPNASPAEDTAPLGLPAGTENSTNDGELARGVPQNDGEASTTPNEHDD